MAVAKAGSCGPCSVRQPDLAGKQPQLRLKTAAGSKRVAFVANYNFWCEWLQCAAEYAIVPPRHQWHESKNNTPCALPPDGKFASTSG
jgi:glutathione S-transferase